MQLSSRAESEEVMYNQNERKIIADLNAKLYRKERKIYWLNKRVEAQQQDIEQLKEVNRQLMWENISDNMSENITAEQAEQIKALIADKDAQAEKLKLMETVLKCARTALESVRRMNPEEFCFVFEVRCAIDALLGGKEDA